MVTAERLKSYLRLPPDDEEDLSVFLSAARAKARAAGIPPTEENAQYDLFILSLAAFYYDNRSFSPPEENVQRMINSFILELR